MLTRRHAFAFLPLALSVLVLASQASAQKLPTGEHHGNRARDVDILHYRADLSFDLEAGRIAGRATIDLSPLRTLKGFSLDAYDLSVTALRVNGEKADFDVAHHRIDIVLSEAAERGTKLEVEIEYSAEPDAGMYFQPLPSDPAKIFVHTYGEGGLHANWLPIYNDLNDKFTTEMVATVPPGNVAISNGKLLGESQSDHGDGATTFHWRQDQPHSNYLISIYVGDFERGEIESALEGKVPQSIWVPRGRMQEGQYTFRTTRAMVDFFSARFGYDYPWVKHDQIAVPDYAIGAMEHTGVTGHNASVLRSGPEAPLDFGAPVFNEYWMDWSAEATISHELAHHWFGDNVTCSSLGRLWLNESFASYLMMLWDEESVGVDQLHLDVDLARRHYLDYVAREHTIRGLEHHDFDDTNTIYNTEHTYLKGAAVLHTLRFVLGDEAFFGGLSDYLHRHEFENVESSDLRIALESRSGLDLEWFFDDWVTGAGHPVLEAKWTYLEDRGLLDLSIEQVQPLVEGQGLFRLPVEVVIATAERTWAETIWIEKAEEKRLIPMESKPFHVTLDPSGYLVAEIRAHADFEELLAETKQTAMIGRMRSYGELANRFDARDETKEALRKAIAGEAFWGLRAEAAQQAGFLPSAAALELAEAALADPDYRVRKAAVLGLRSLAGPEAMARIRRVVDEEANDDVVGTAIVALAHVNPSLETSFLADQLKRDSWYDTIRLASLQAAETLGRVELASVVQGFAGPAWNQDLRMAAIGAWIASEPTDPELRSTLLAMAHGPQYPVQQRAIEELGRLGIEEALPWLQSLVDRDIDGNLTVLASDAVENIERMRAASVASAAGH